MPSELREHQHEISNTDGTDGFVFGTEDTGYLTLSRPVMEGADVTSGDRARPQEDGRMFGRDLRGAKSVVFEIGVITDHLSRNAHRANLDYLDRLENLWTDERWRYDPNAMAMLRSFEAGQVWRAYGRPRRYEEVVGVTTQQGFSTVVADFPMVDSSWYSDAEYRTEVRLRAGSEGGLKAPLVAPLSTVQATAGSNSVIIGGTRATWPVIEFHGPVTNPEVSIGNGALRVGLSRFLPSGESVVYDPRPWERSVYRVGDRAGMAGYISGRTPQMRDAKLRPGGYDVTYTGLDPTGTSKVVVRWRNARARP